MANKIFKRKIYDRLLQWKQNDAGRTALLVQGARRIGKSTIVEEFAKKEYESYLLIDFSKAPKRVHELFEDISDLNYLFVNLQLIYHVQLLERRSLIVFDEVQFQPRARQAIKHLVADHRYDYIETGSLISIYKNVKDILIPSEEVTINMYPMDYEEFRWALGDTETIPLIREIWEKRMTISDGTHRQLMRDFRMYMLVGGMPQAVNAYLETNNLGEVDRKKRDIISLYEKDFRKLDPSGYTSALFQAIPAQLNKNSSRYRISSVMKHASANKTNGKLIDLRESMAVNICYHVNDPNAGMAQSIDLNRYKIYMGDTGLFITLAFKDKEFTENIIYSKLLSDKLSANLGYIYENVVAQMLRAAGNELYYHTFPTKSEKHNYEVDFLLARGNKINPIEVKSSGYNSHVSLDAFCRKFSSRVANKYLIYTKSLHKDAGITLLPVYMTGLI